ncbi:MAG: serine/threonine protein kinase, partial [Planctomycetota bacterium]|nr:serine/threonine protein kinase [Planctomycetota bacterium]
MAPAPHLEDAAQPLAQLEQIQGQAARTTIQLGADFLSYARATSTPVEFKHQLVERLLPTVPRRGQPYLVKEGASFGKFTIAEQLGKGGMAVVYRAVDPERGSGSGSGSVERRQQVALKVMREDISHDPEYVRRFLREAANAALIDHPNVVRVHEVGSVKGRLYFTMELIEGETLKETLARGPLPEEQGLQVLCQLVDGLIAAHERGIGHRDLKPSNIMLITGRTRYGLELEGDDFDVQVKVTDFGLAHMLDADTSDVMPEGRFLGTAKYVAPEVIKGGETTLKSDLFSLGVLAFQMFAGRAPFAARSKLEFITANLQAEAPPLDSVAPVSRDLARLVDAMLKKEPAERPDAISLRRDLGRLAGRRTRRERVVVADDPSSAFHRGLPDAPRRAAPAGVIIGVAAGLVVVVVALALVLRRPPPGLEAIGAIRIGISQGMM